uniref:Uncharacterized protein n=1 Tax=Physcomitrium patens TaxID=3218 RepID=A0A2K1IS57_PHYPA|nr:hypothetical protein PHYPA_026238 [Physcomitrium patens]
MVLLSGLIVFGMYHMLPTQVKLNFYRRVIVCCVWLDDHPCCEAAISDSEFVWACIAPNQLRTVRVSHLYIHHCTVGEFSRAGLTVGNLSGWGVVQGMTNYWTVT